MTAFETSRAAVRVELDFELAGHRYRVIRGLTSAELYLDGAAQRHARCAQIARNRRADEAPDRELHQCLGNACLTCSLEQRNG